MNQHGYVDGGLFKLVLLLMLLICISDFLGIIFQIFLRIFKNYFQFLQSKQTELGVGKRKKKEKRSWERFGREK